MSELYFDLYALAAPVCIHEMMDTLHKFLDYSELMLVEDFVYKYVVCDYSEYMHDCLNEILCWVILYEVCSFRKCCHLSPS